ncbi:hypothetical protein F4861DRAFT_544575 [Xylaria intraflava]|nr:hypothetical protein F4861DRAFT_544575 [Xylaria intraflava]
MAPEKTGPAHSGAAKPIGYWKYANKGMAAPSITAFLDAKTDLERTAFILDILRKSDHNQVRDMIEENPVIRELISLKSIRSKGAPVPIDISTSRTQQCAALAAHLVLEQKNVRPCGPCAGKGKGPFAKCISFGPDVFAGACNCCQYSSSATSCTFHRQKKGHKYAVQSDSQNDRDDKEEEEASLQHNITPKTLRQLPTETVQYISEMTKKELRRREHALLADDDDEEVETPTKKRKHKPSKLSMLNIYVS